MMAHDGVILGNISFLYGLDSAEKACPTNADVEDTCRLALPEVGAPSLSGWAFSTLVWVVSPSLSKLPPLDFLLCGPGLFVSAVVCQAGWRQLHGETLKRLFLIFLRSARYSSKLVRLHLAILPIALLAVISSTVLTVIGLEDASRDSLILSLNLLLTSAMASTIILLALSPALHLTLGLALRDPEFEGRVRRGELTARILVAMGGKVGNSHTQVEERGAAISQSATRREDVEQTI